MLTAAEKIGYLAVGGTAQAFRQVRKASRTLRGAMGETEAEGRKVVEESRARLAESLGRLEPRAREVLDKEAKRLGLATREDLAVLQKRLDQIASQLSTPA